MIYLDHAATSHPKPASVVDKMTWFISQGCANPGRASHPLANDAARLIFDTRERLIRFFRAGSNAQAIFTANITASLNVILKGLLKSGDEVIVSSMEHNAMMRPLRQLEQDGVTVTVIACDSRTGLIDLKELDKAISPATKLVALNHGSNTFGTIQPVAGIGRICRKNDCLFLVDTAQTAGCIPINMLESEIDFLTFTGHKGLLGPMGIGGFVMSEKAQAERIVPLMTGGTGSNSELEVQPDFLPDALESGTPNLPGIAGLNAGLRWLEEHTVSAVFQHEQQLITQLINGLNSISGIRVFGLPPGQNRVGVVSFVIDGMDNGEVDEFLSYEHEICCRTGLHCSPASHKTMGTFPQGTIRLSVGVSTTEQEIHQVLEVLQRLVSRFQP
ncbi:aminotransferase class V-fold PLP-dependent enzyme [Vibrio quintilis]|uniref:cysteine desulfurase n=1 Tax=Vibrio quintilis TaxID=1117707 RepID=A0A1M7Z067_9VIBR|nr:aminotransferase class V-fold PLP-dependent enzyme [Vibrio quintilis]SHO58213.1 putative cysteine desulfurase [Vibrio quintilis]